MNIIPVHTSSYYDVCIGSGLLDRVGELSLPVVSGRNALIVSDSNVWPLYGPRLQSSLEQHGFVVKHFEFQAGEPSKTPQTLLRIIQTMCNRGLTRSDVVYALGGGVTGDLTGLASALYLRGISCIQVPTSLLAMVDSSVGGKTAVDLPEGKNLVGTFTQPRGVICDPDVLKTLEPRVMAEGWAEIIKYGMLGSQDLLDALANGPDHVDLESIIAHCVGMKRDLVAEDEQDTGVRQLLNFGHTIGHAIEQKAHYTLYHGEAVAIGMAIMTRAWVRLGHCDQECLTILEDLLHKYDLPDQCNIECADLLEAAKADKKRRGDTITLVQPIRPGMCMLNKSDYKELEEILNVGMKP